MYNCELFNCLSVIIDDIKKVYDEKKDVEVVYAGNSKYVPLINATLSSRGTCIHAVIDNDVEKQGKFVSQVHQSEYLFSTLGLKKYDVKIYAPSEVVNDSKHQTFFIQTLKADEIEAQLISLGVDSNCIHKYGDRSRVMMRKSEWGQSLLDGKKIIELEEMQKLEFELLMEFKDFCDKHKLRYFLSNGTLLGAIRHKGFIPWDDDIDIEMPYEDYEIFMREYTENNKYIAMDFRKDDNYFLSFGKLVNKKYLLLHPGFPIAGSMGVYIDLFPITSYPDNEDSDKFWKQNVIYWNAWNEYYAVRQTLKDVPIKDIRQEIINARYLLPFDTDSKYVGTRHYISYVKQWKLPRKCYSSSVECEFCSEKFPVPIGWKDVLEKHYGDYLKLPPIEERVSHSFEAYIKKETYKG